MSFFPPSEIGMMNSIINNAIKTLIVCGALGLLLGINLVVELIFIR